MIYGIILNIETIKRAAFTGCGVQAFGADRTRLFCITI